VSTIIRTGSNLCRTLFLLECPICGIEFTIEDGKFVSSSTLGDRVLVCEKHDCELTIEQELKIQEALRSAIDNPKGSIVKDSKVLKKTTLLEKYGMPSWVEGN
jgi:hypothetical protein